MNEKKVSYFNIVFYYFLLTVVTDIISNLTFTRVGFDIGKSLLIFLAISLTLLPIYFFYSGRSLSKKISMGEGLALTIASFALDLIILGIVFLIASKMA